MTHLTIETPVVSLPVTPAPVRQPAGSAYQDVTRGSVSGSVDAPVQRQAPALVNEHRRRDGCPDLTWTGG